MRSLLFIVAFGLAAVAAVGPLACGDDAQSGAPDAATDVADADADASLDAGDAAVVARGKRVLGLTVDVTDLQFPAKLDVAREAGAQTTAVTFAWNDIERPYDGGAPDPDAGDAAAPPTFLSNAGLHIVNLVLADRRVAATLAVEAFDVGGSRAPADLAGLALDDPAALARYDALLDYVFDQVRDTQLTALIVASGAEAWLAADAQRAASFAAFVTHAAAHAKTLRPGVVVGFTIDALDVAESHAAQLAAAWAASDVGGVDYVVPVEAVQGKPSVADLVPADFARIASLVPASKPILLRQAGYPSASAAGGDEPRQATFVGETFRAWDRSPDRFVAVVFRELEDSTPEQAAAIAARRGRSDAPFLALAQSLGMRARDGREKPAFGVLRAAARARGW